MGKCTTMKFEVEGRAQGGDAPSPLKHCWENVSSLGLPRFFDSAQERPCIRPVLGWDTVHDWATEELPGCAGACAWSLGRIVCVALG